MASTAVFSCCSTASSYTGSLPQVRIFQARLLRSRESICRRQSPPCFSFASRLGIGLDLRLRQRSNQSKKSSRIAVTASGSGKNAVPAAERVLAGLGYFLPLFDGLQYGRYFFAQYSAAEAFFRPLFPLLRFYSSIPYSNFIAFFTLYLAVVRNPNFGRYVRFNSMQACVLDVLIILPLIVQRILNPRSGIGLDLLIIFYNTIFIFLLASVVFGVLSCLLGKTPRLPLVAEAADNQLF